MQVQTTKGEDMKLSIDQPGRASVARRLTTAGAAAAMVLGIALASVGPASAGTSAKGLATATARLNAYTAPPKWRGPYTPLHTAGLSGDKVVYISANEGIPVLHYWSTTIKGLLSTTAGIDTVSYTHLRAHETVLDLVCRL